MFRFKKIIFIIFFINIIFTDTSYAYLDPGTLSIVVQAILGFLASVIVFFSDFLKNLSLKIKSLLKINKKVKK